MGTAKIKIDGEEFVISVNDDETILEAANRQDVDAPYACMSGTCTSCQAHLDSGEVEMEFHDALSDDEVADGEILVCQAKLKSENVEVTFA